MNDEFNAMLPPLDDAKAEEMIGKVVLVGVTRYGGDGQVDHLLERANDRAGCHKGAGGLSKICAEYRGRVFSAGWEVLGIDHARAVPPDREPVVGVRIGTLDPPP